MFLLGHSELCHRIARSETKTTLAVLFPLAEVEYYAGVETRGLVSQQISRYAQEGVRIVAPSRFVSGELAASCALASPPAVVSHGVPRLDCPRRISLPTAVTILRGGPFARHKNLDVLLDAWQGVTNTLPEALLTVIGVSASGRSATGLRNVRFVGCVSENERMKLLRGARIFALPSAIEAFGLAFLEALSLGIPVVALRSTATPELVKHGINGILIEGGAGQSRVPGVASRPKAAVLKSALLHLLKNDSDYDLQRSGARSSVANRTIDAMCDGYLAQS